jgi:hypothetical protein
MTLFCPDLPREHTAASVENAGHCLRRFSTQIANMVNR